MTLECQGVPTCRGR